MKDLKDLTDEAADAFGIREKHKKRFAVVLDVLQAVVCWFKSKDEKRDDQQD